MGTKDMGFKCGIVGLPNVGKSSLFNAITSSEIPAENYPFCTIDPNVGVVAVPDKRLEAIAQLAKPKKIIPANMEFVDIAGLVKGAADGEGLGNQFLAHIRETHAIAHVVRCFEDENVVHVAGHPDPEADHSVIQTELALADLESVLKALDRVARQAKSGDKKAPMEKALLDRVRAVLESDRPARSLAMTEEEAKTLRSFNLLTAKPVLYIANVGEADVVRGNAMSERVAEIAAAEGCQAVVICAALEAELAALAEPEREEYLRALGLEEPGLNRLIRAGYTLLGLQTYFTAGPKEVRAWTIHKGCTAPEAAGVIHTDFEHGFIRAEVVGYEDYIRYKGEQGAKDAGRWRLEGKDYVVQDGDVMHFRFNV
jgi:hypothetical protein